VLNLWRQEAIEQARVDSLVFPPPTEFALLDTSLRSMSGDALYAGDSQTLPADIGTGGLSIGSSHCVTLRTTLFDEDAPATVHSPLSFSTINQNGKMRYRCQCGTETARRSDMRRHQKYGRVHYSSPQFVCVCGRKYTRKDSHQNHKKECRRASSA